MTNKPLENKFLIIQISPSTRKGKEKMQIQGSNPAVDQYRKKQEKTGEKSRFSPNFGE
jgi:hypothetical protein